MSSLLKKLIREDSGTATIEAAVVFPMLMTLGFGAIEFSNAFYDHQEISTGIRDAARYMARVTDPSNNPCNNSTAVGYAKNLAVNAVISGGSARIPGFTKSESSWTTGNVTITCTAVANPVNAATGERSYRGQSTLYIVTVTTAVTYPQFGFMTYLGLSAPTINLSHSERWIGG